MKTLPAALLVLAACAASLACAARSATPAADTAAPAPAAKTAAKTQAERLQWFTDAHFGLFLHWGVYSHLGDEWQGKKCDKAEQIQWEKRIPNAAYAKVAAQFNPAKFDAKAWVRAAKGAGMKYIVITAKHHDGFAMFDSPCNPYNIVKATPFARDPMKDLAAACREEGIKLCFYYSLGREWHDDSVPNPPGGKSGNFWDFPVDTKRTMDAYLERKAKPQLRELLTQYGPVGAIWFDTPEYITAAQSRALKDLIGGLQPDCLVNARVANGLGDYDISEQFIPGFKKGAKPWETCLTMNRHWGFDKFDDHWKSADSLVRHAVDIASKGGNLLLNIGPTGEGELPAASVERLEAMGRWMKANSEAFHGAGPTCFGKEFGSKAAVNTSGVDAHGVEIAKPKAGHGVGKASDAFAAPKGWRCTTKPGAVYIHLLDWPGASFTLEGMPGAVAEASFLDGGQAVPFTQQEGKLTLQLPKQAPGEGIRVVKLRLAEAK